MVFHSSIRTDAWSWFSSDLWLLSMLDSGEIHPYTFNFEWILSLWCSGLVFSHLISLPNNLRCSTRWVAMIIMVLRCSSHWTLYSFFRSLISCFCDIDSVAAFFIEVSLRLHFDIPLCSRVIDFIATVMYHCYSCSILQDYITESCKQIRVWYAVFKTIFHIVIHYLVFE